MKIEYIKVATPPTDWEILLKAIAQCPDGHSVRILASELKRPTTGLGGNISRYGRPVNVTLRDKYIVITPRTGNVSAPGSSTKSTKSHTKTSGRPNRNPDSVTLSRRPKTYLELEDLIKRFSEIRIPKRLWGNDERSMIRRNGAIHDWRRRHNFKVDGTRRSSKMLILSRPRGYKHSPLRAAPEHIVRYNRQRHEEFVSKQTAAESAPVAYTPPVPHEEKPVEFVYHK